MDRDFARSMLDGVPAPLILVGHDNTIRHMNPMAVTLFTRDFSGRHYQTLLRQPGVLDAISRALNTGMRQETRYLHSDHAQESTYRVVCAPANMTGGTGTLISFEDISSLEAAGQMRRDFVANVSHELRTPLTAILGFIETLRGPARNDAVARDRFLATMEQEAGRMNRLVDDLLSLSRVEDEERVRPTQLVDLAPLVASVCNTLRPLAGETRLHIEMSEPVEVIGDEDQIRQVLTNLIENAIKYGSDGGRVRIGATKVARDPVLRSAAIQLDVEDFGAGIDEIHVHRVTERFYRADSHRSREMGGTGLGLAIVKHIMNRHRGRLKIRSVPGQGSCFSAVFPDPDHSA